VIYTDHKPLTFALKKQAEPWTARQQRQLSYLAEFAVELRHVAGASNVVADMLSRPEPGPGPGQETEAGLSKAATCLSQLYINRPSPGSSTPSASAVGLPSSVQAAAAAAAKPANKAAPPKVYSPGDGG
jgi:hypothetical protein